MADVLICFPVCSIPCANNCRTEDAEKTEIMTSIFTASPFTHSLCAQKNCRTENAEKTEITAGVFIPFFVYAFALCGKKYFRTNA